jgi:hypothetical protein
MEIIDRMYTGISPYCYYARCPFCRKTSMIYKENLSIKTKCRHLKKVSENSASWED